jgi:hypothetical protein
MQIGSGELLEVRELSLLPNPEMELFSDAKPWAADS